MYEKEKKMKQAFTNFLKRFEVNGYSPLSMFNIVLAVIIMIGGYVIYSLTHGSGFGKAQDDKIALIISLIATSISSVLLFIRNLKIKSVPKFILYTILQFVLAIIVAIIYIIVFIFGLLVGGNSSSTSSRKVYSNEEDRYAKANGYFDAQSANEKGFDTSQANNAGFDYTQKRE